MHNQRGLKEITSKYRDKRYKIKILLGKFGNPNHIIKMCILPRYIVDLSMVKVIRIDHPFNLPPTVNTEHCTSPRFI